jgi:hypothetical protein
MEINPNPFFLFKMKFTEEEESALKQFLESKLGQM